MRAICAHPGPQGTHCNRDLNHFGKHLFEGTFEQAAEQSGPPPVRVITHSDIESGGACSGNLAQTLMGSWKCHGCGDTMSREAMKAFEERNVAYGQTMGVVLAIITDAEEYVWGQEHLKGSEEEQKAQEQCDVYHVFGHGSGTRCDRERGHEPMHEGEGYAPGTRTQWWP